MKLRLQQQYRDILFEFMDKPILLNARFHRNNLKDLGSLNFG